MIELESFKFENKYKGQSINFKLLLFVIKMTIKI